MTTTSKELARENLLMLLQSLPAFPQATLQKIDYDGVLMLLARANDVPMRDLLKDQSEIMREEEAAQQQAQYNQQLQMQMAQNPGAQIPVIPQ
jgi:adenylate kinase